MSKVGIYSTEIRGEICSVSVTDLSNQYSVISDSLVRVYVSVSGLLLQVNVGTVFKENTVKLGNTAICKSVIKERGGLVFSFLEWVDETESQGKLSIELTLVSHIEILFCNSSALREKIIRIQVGGYSANLKLESIDSGRVCSKNMMKNVEQESSSTE